MKTLLVAALLLLSFGGAKAALFINNNTNCQMIVMLRAHDLNHNICGLESGRLQMEPISSAAFNNVATLNTTNPYWQNGPATTSGGTAVWGWDGAIVNSLGGTMWVEVGYPGTCYPTASVVTPNGCLGSNVTVDWYTVGSNTFIDIY